jgi:hypothetical protein
VVIGVLKAFSDWPLAVGQSQHPTANNPFTTMNTKHIIIALALIAGPFVGAYLFIEINTPPPQTAQLKLEEILSIKELHLVKHTYNDLFFLHRKNNPTKPVRAVAQVPVSITGYINLKDIKIIRVNDTIRKVILPKAHVQEPNYAVDQMVITKTRSFQLHAGADLYPEVTQYLKAVLNERKDSVRNLAIRNHILEQAEAEGKDYIESLLKAVAREDVVVTFNDGNKDKMIAAFQKHNHLEEKTILQHMHFDTTYYTMDGLAMQLTKD